MQYLSSIIVSWAPFLADPDFQIILIAVMTAQLLYKLIKKSFKILATTIKVSSVAAMIGLVLYLAIEQPSKDERSEVKESMGNKVGAALNQLKTDLPTFVSDVKNSIEKDPKG